MLAGELFRESVRSAAEDRGMAEGIQSRPAAQQFGVSNSGRVRARKWRERTLRKRRWLRHLGKRSAFPTITTETASPLAMPSAAHMS